MEGLGTVVVDEIHTLANIERGPRLNGLIKRLKTLFPNTQLIGLSATVKNPQEMAKEFDMKLVKYEIRPVPLERHLIFVKSEQDREELMAKLSRKEHQTISQKGFSRSNYNFH